MHCFTSGLLYLPVPPFTSLSASGHRAAAAKILHQESLWLAIDYSVTLCKSRSTCMHEYLGRYAKSPHLLCPPNTTLPIPDQRARDWNLLYLAGSSLTVDSQSVTPRFQHFLYFLNTFNTPLRVMLKPRVDDCVPHCRLTEHRSSH